MSFFNLDPDRAGAVEGACLCHGDRRARPVKRIEPASALISAPIIRPLLNLAAARMLEQQRSPPSWTRNPHLEFLRLLQADRWVEETALMLREPDLGLTALSELRRGAGDVVEFAAERAEKLRDALLVLTRHVTGIIDTASIHLHVRDGSAILTIGSELHLSRVLRDYWVGTLALAVSRWLGARVKMELWFTGPRPSHALAYRRAFGEIAVGFYAPCDALVVPASSLCTSMPLADPKLHDFLVRVAQRLPVCARHGLRISLPCSSRGRD